MEKLTHNVVLVEALVNPMRSFGEGMTLLESPKVRQGGQTFESLYWTVISYGNLLQGR